MHTHTDDDFNDYSCLPESDRCDFLPLVFFWVPVNAVDLFCSALVS